MSETEEELPVPVGLLLYQSMDQPCPPSPNSFPCYLHLWVFSGSTSLGNKAETQTDAYFKRRARFHSLVNSQLDRK